MEISELRRSLLKGQVIPAHPLALTSRGQMDDRRQRALTRYYLDAGAGGVAVGVHTTQFEIHDPGIGLYGPVLELAVEEVHRWEVRNPNRGRIIRVAGVVGRTEQALREASTARDFGYDCALLSLSVFRESSADEMIRHCREVAEVLPLMGFYLQPAVGGRTLGYSFWRRFAEIETAVAVKIAPFSRYQTIDVVRGVADAGRAGEVALYTGNDDNIVADLLTPFEFKAGYDRHALRITGGLLGQWAVWTRSAVEMFEKIRRVREDRREVPPELLSLGVHLTDANGVIFDREHGFAGCLPGIHEILRRQGILAGTWCLNPEENLSAGQSKEIDRICRMYPHLTDDAFVDEHLDDWLSG